VADKRFGRAGKNDLVAGFDRLLLRETFQVDAFTIKALEP
jgi:hypothetical protein